MVHSHIEAIPCINEAVNDELAPLGVIEVWINNSRWIEKMLSQGQSKIFLKKPNAVGFL